MIFNIYEIIDNEFVRLRQHLHDGYINEEQYIQMWMRLVEALEKIGCSDKNE